MFKKAISFGLMLGLLVGSASVSTADASWLSKALDRLSKSAESSSTSGTDGSSDSSYESSIRLPQESDYHFRGGQLIGSPLSDHDMSVVGVIPGNTFQEIMNSLGRPTSDQGKTITYGGITFGEGYTLTRDSNNDRITYIYIDNRDATTARGIAVGDSLEKVYKVYGRPDYVGYADDKGDYWFYGQAVWATDMMKGIQFENDGRKVTRIAVINS